MPIHMQVQGKKRESEREKRESGRERARERQRGGREANAGTETWIRRGT